MTAGTCDGYTAVPNVLLEALALGDLTKRQIKIGLALLRKTLGYRKASDDLTSQQLAALTGLAPTHCRAAVRELVDKGVVSSAPGRYGQVLALTDPAGWGGPNPFQGEDKNSPPPRTESVPPGGPNQSLQADRISPQQNTPPKYNPKTQPPPPAAAAGSRPEDSGRGGGDVSQGRTRPHGRRHAANPGQRSLPLFGTVEGNPPPASAAGHTGGLQATLHYPPGLDRAQHSLVASMLDGVPVDAGQALLDVLSAALGAGEIRKGPVAYLGGLLRRYREGSFDPTPGMEVDRRRRRAAINLRAVEAASRAPPAAPARSAGERRAVAAAGCAGLRAALGGRDG